MGHTRTAVPCCLELGASCTAICNNVRLDLHSPESRSAVSAMGRSIRQRTLHNTRLPPWLVTGKGCFCNVHVFYPELVFSRLPASLLRPPRAMVMRMRILRVWVSNSLSSLHLCLCCVSVCVGWLLIPWCGQIAACMC